MPDPVITAVDATSPADLPENAPAATPAAVTPDAPKTLEELAWKLTGQTPSTDPSQQIPATQPDAGQAPAAPGVGQGDGTGVPKAGTEAEPDKGQVAPVVSEEDILAALQPTVTPEAQAAHDKRDLGASRKEAMRMKKVIEGYEAVHEAQGTAVHFDETTGESAGIYATDKYNGGTSDADAPKFSSLSEAQQTALETDQDALMAYAYGLGKDAMTRIAPTVEKPIESISPEKEAAVVKHMLSETLDDGETKKYPNLEENMRMIRQNLDNPSNKALRAAYSVLPGIVLASLNASVDSTRSQLAQQAQLINDAKTKKEQDAIASPTPAPSLGGQPILNADGKPADAATALKQAIKALN